MLQYFLCFRKNLSGWNETVTCSPLSLWFLQCLLLEFTLFLPVPSEISDGPYTNNLLPFTKCWCFSLLKYFCISYFTPVFFTDRLLHCIFLFFTFSIFSEEFWVAWFLNIYFFLLSLFLKFLCLCLRSKWD